MGVEVAYRILVSALVPLGLNLNWVGGLQTKGLGTGLDNSFGAGGAMPCRGLLVFMTDFTDVCLGHELLKNFDSY